MKNLDLKNIQASILIHYKKTIEKLSIGLITTGYVYGYLRVKEYLEKNGLKIKDIIKKEWKDILLIQANHD